MQGRQEDQASEAASGLAELILEAPEEFRFGAVHGRMAQGHAAQPAAPGDTLIKLAASKLERGTTTPIYYV